MREAHPVCKEVFFNGSTGCLTCGMQAGEMAHDKVLETKTVRRHKRCVAIIRPSVVVGHEGHRALLWKQGRMALRCTALNAVSSAGPRGCL